MDNEPDARIARCPQCGIDKPIADFYRRGRASGHRSPYCKTCTIVRVREWRRSNRESYRASRQRMKYGITEEQYQQLLEIQGGGCAICGSRSSRNGQCPRLVIDHCHTTGAVRGLLCHPCNTAIGQLGDDPDRARKAADYLESFRTRPPILEPEPGKTCVMCGQEFMPRRKSNITCSPECSRDRSIERKRRANQRPGTKETASAYRQRSEIRERRRELQRSYRATPKDDPSNRDIPPD